MDGSQGKTEEFLNLAKLIGKAEEDRIVVHEIEPYPHRPEVPCIGRCRSKSNTMTRQSPKHISLHSPIVLTLTVLTITRQIHFYLILADDGVTIQMQHRSLFDMGSLRVSFLYILAQPHFYSKPAKKFRIFCQSQEVDFVRGFC